MSVTPDPRAAAEEFLRQSGITWPCLYAAPEETLRALHVLNGNGVRTTESTPTLYLVRADGTVVWNDGRARSYHKSVDRAIEELEQAIDNALKAG